MSTPVSAGVSRPARAYRLSGWVRRNQILSAYLILFPLAWGAMFSRMFGFLDPFPFWVQVVVGLIAGWMPAFAAVLISAISGGRDEVIRLISRFGIWRLGWGWYLLGLLMMALVILSGIGLHILSGGARPTIPAAASTSAGTAVLTFAILLIVGVLLNTEEVLWRGFALPRLQQRYGWLPACLLIVIPEVLLHLPYFWDPDAIFYQNVGIGWFSAFSIAAVIVYAWIFNNTRGSLIIVTLMHASQNAWSTLFSDNSLRPFQFTVGVLWAMALAVIVYSYATRRQRKTGHPYPSKIS